MAPRNRPIIQSQRLRDQVYNVIRDELRSGQFEPGQRLYELDLAEKYGVSRTPIREALFQLARDGLLVEAERGYVFPKDTKQDIAHRLDLRLLLDPPIARHAATDATSEQIKALSRTLEKEKASVDKQDPKLFIEANSEYRTMLRSMCQNQLLAKSASLIDDQFQFARITVFQDPANRKLTVEYHDKIFRAVESRQPDLAEQAGRAFLLELKKYFNEHGPHE